MRVLAISQSFAPGFRGGSIQALSFMAEHLGRRCEFLVVARDRDPGADTPLPGITVDTWTTHGHARAFYATHRHGPQLVAALVRATRPDVIFLNSVFATGSVSLLALRRLGFVRVPVVLAPEGELAPGALAQKPWRKRLFLGLARATALWRDVVFVARDANEARDIRHVWPGAGTPVVLPCLGPAEPRACAAPRDKVTGAATLLYLSRITPKKHLAFLLEVLQAGVPGDLELAIVGPVDDAGYWTRCQALMATLPESVRATWHGEALPDDVPAWLSRAHALALPSLGENYGYVVAEALEAGRPVLVSDRTPWRDLQAAGAGWTLPLTPSAWAAAIAALLALSQHAFDGRCRDARAHGLAARPADDTAAATLATLRRAAHLDG